MDRICRPTGHLNIPQTRLRTQHVPISRPLIIPSSSLRSAQSSLHGRDILVPTGWIWPRGRDEIAGCANGAITAQVPKPRHRRGLGRLDDARRDSDNWMGLLALLGGSGIGPAGPRVVGWTYLHVIYWPGRRPKNPIRINTQFGFSSIFRGALLVARLCPRPPPKPRVYACISALVAVALRAAQPFGLFLCAAERVNPSSCLRQDPVRRLLEGLLERNGAQAFFGEDTPRRVA